MFGRRASLRSSAFQSVEKGETNDEAAKNEASSKSTREAFEWHKAKLGASQAFRVLSKLPKCVHNSIDAHIERGPFLLVSCFISLAKFGVSSSISKY